MPFKLGIRLPTQRETGLELLRVKQSKHPQEGILRRNAILEPQKLPQPGNMCPQPCSHVFNRVAVRKNRRDCHHQLLNKVMSGSVARLARASTSVSISFNAFSLITVGATQKTRVNGIY